MVINQTLLSLLLRVLRHLLVLSFSFLGGNIDPKHRSQLKAMQLLAIPKRPVIKKYGCNKILRTFMTQLDQLEQVRFIMYDNIVDYNNNSIVVNLLNNCSRATHEQDNNFTAMTIIIYYFALFTIYMYFFCTYVSSRKLKITARPVTAIFVNDMYVFSMGKGSLLPVLLPLFLGTTQHPRRLEGSKSEAPLH